VKPRFIYLTTVKQIEERYELLIYHANAEKNLLIQYSMYDIITHTINLLH